MSKTTAQQLARQRLAARYYDHKEHCNARNKVKLKSKKSKSKPQTLKFSPFSGFFLIIKILHIFIKNILTSYK